MSSDEKYLRASIVEYVDMALPSLPPAVRKAMLVVFFVISPGLRQVIKW